MSDLLAVGLNHKTASVELRERLAMGAEDIRELYGPLQGAGLGEVMVVSTCNRVEIYGVCEEARVGDRVLEALASLRSLDLGELRSHTFVRSAASAARHIFRVAASLESMVVGEPQILGQVKEAYELAKREQTVGAVLDRCMSMAFRGAKRVRTETEIARGAASVSSVAVDLAMSIFGELRSCGVLLVGAGEMAQQAGVYLRAGGASELTVVNRSSERGERLAREIGGHYMPWDQLEQQLRRADIVVTSTGSTQPVIDRELMKRVLRARRGKAVFLVDIAVPRDVAPDVGNLEQVFLYNIDDLQGIVHDNMRARSAEADRASGLVDEEVDNFLSWQRTRAIGPLIASLQRHARGIVEAELARTKSKLDTLDAGQQEVVHALVRGVVKKLLHQPMVNLRAAASEGTQSGVDLATALEELFALKTDSGNPKPRSKRTPAKK
ncbi:MAG: glutamyl-tRNA reductase, partial [Nannocystaceae bacterium]